MAVGLIEISLVVQLFERGADRRTADAEALGERILHQAAARRNAERDDVLHDQIADQIVQRGKRILLLEDFELFLIHKASPSFVVSYYTEGNWKK